MCAAWENSNAVALQKNQAITFFDISYELISLIKNCRRHIKFVDNVFGIRQTCALANSDGLFGTEALTGPWPSLFLDHLLAYLKEEEEEESI